MTRSAEDLENEAAFAKALETAFLPPTFTGEAVEDMYYGAVLVHRVAAGYRKAHPMLSVRESYKQAGLKIGNLLAELCASCCVYYEASNA